MAYLILVAAIEGGDILLQSMLRLMYKYGPIRVEHFINVKGNFPHFHFWQYVTAYIASAELEM